MLFNGHAYEVYIKTTEYSYWDETVRIQGRNFDATLPDEWAKKITAAIDRALKELCQEIAERKAREKREKRREEAIAVYTRNARRLID
jgi:hypothetical protein